MEVKTVPDKELLEAMEQYAVQTNFFLEFIERKCPGLTKVQTVELATLLIVKMAAILCETETAEVWLNQI